MSNSTTLIGNLQEDTEARNNHERVKPRRKTRLRDVFGPFIPIFVPFTDLWDPNGRRALPQGLMPTLLEALRPTVPYITVVQHDLGMCLATCEFREDCDGGGGSANRSELYRLPSNVLVLSAGGFGHVPIPLLKQPETPRPSRRGKKLSFDRYFASFTGKVENGPVRRRLLDILAAQQQEFKGAVDQHGHRRLYHYYGSNWREVVSQSTYSLCPRGHGRTVRRNTCFDLSISCRLLRYLHSSH